MSFLDRLESADRHRRGVQAVPPLPPEAKDISPRAPIEKAANPPTVGCTGCYGNWWRKALNFGFAVTDVSIYAAQMAVGYKVEESVYEERKAVCQKCPATDKKGDILFREFKEGNYSCGVPLTAEIFRVPEEDGCGCWLNLKWWSKTEKCPLKEPRW